MKHKTNTNISTEIIKKTFGLSVSFRRIPLKNILFQNVPEGRKGLQSDDFILRSTREIPQKDRALKLMFIQGELFSMPSSQGLRSRDRWLWEQE